MAEAVAAAVAAASAAEAAVAASAWITANAAAINAALVISANAAYGATQQRRAARKQRDAYNASLKDREVMIRSAIAPRRIVLGRDRISGPIVYAQSTGAKGEYLHLVIALAHGECDAIEEVWFNDTLLPDPDAGGYITSGEFTAGKATARAYSATIAGSTLTLPHVASRVTAVAKVDTSYVTDSGTHGSILVSGWSHSAPSNTITGLSPDSYVVNYETSVALPRVRIKKHLGGPGQVADADLVAESGGKWTAAHVGNGITYLYVRLQYDQDVWGQIGIPNISCVVRGGKAFDPRSGLTVWSDNAALLAAKWLRDGTFGLGATSAQVPAAELGAEANIADETINLDAGGTLTQKRYVFNGSFDSEESPRDVLEDILGSMAGTAVWVQGRWLLRAGAYRTPAPELNEDALAGAGVSIVPRTTRSELFNAVRVKHRDRTQGWAEVSAPLVANAGYQAQDGGRQIVRTLTLPGEMDTWRAQRLAKIILERARQSVTVELSTSMRGYDLAPTDTVPLRLARYGFAGKVFEVRKRTYDPMGTLQYRLVETAAGVWAWNYGEATVGDLAPDTALPNPYAVPAVVTGLAVDAGPSYILRNRGGTLIARALVVWDAVDDMFVISGGRIDVQWKRTADADWQDTPRVDGDQTRTILSPMPDGEAILVRVRAVNAAGRAGPWATEAENVVRVALYANASLIDATWWRPGAAWEWALNEVPAGENTIVWGSGPHGESQALWQAVAAGTPGTDRDGGWNSAPLATNPRNAFAVDPTKTYRFAVPVRRTAGATAGVYWGPTGGAGAVCDLNTATPNPNAYFVSLASGSPPPLNRWHLLVGYVYPAGSTGLTNAGAGVYDMETGDLIAAGTNFCWDAGVTECSTRAYQYYAATGATMLWAPPQVEVFDSPAGITYLGRQQVTVGAIVDSSTGTGSSGSPGASTRVATLWGPTVTTAADDELNIWVSGVLTETFWSQAAIGKVQAWLTHAPSFGGSQTEFGTRAKYPVPIDVYTNSTLIGIEVSGQIAPGAVTRDYVLRVQIDYIDAAGAAKTCAKDFSVDAQWRVFKRKH